MANFRLLIRSKSAIVISEVIVVSLVQFAIYGLLIRLTNAETLGMWVLVNSLLGFARAADIWSGGLISFVSEARGAADNKRAASFAVTAVVAGGGGYLLLSLLGWLIIDGLAIRLVGLEGAPTIRSSLPLMVASFWLLSVNGMLAIGFLGFERPGLKAGVNILGALLFLVLIFALVPTYEFHGLIVAQVIQALTMLVLGGVIWFWLVVVLSKGKFRVSLLGKILGYGSKSLTVSLTQLAVEPMIKLVVNVYGGLGAVALVELISRLIATTRALILSLGQVLVPAFAQLGAQSAATANLLRRSEARFFIFGVAAFSGLLAAGPFLSSVMLGHHNSQFIWMLWLLSAGWFANQLAAPAYFLCNAQRRVRPLIFCHAIMTLGGGSLAIVGGSVFGIVGAVTGIAFGLSLASIQLWSAVADQRSGEVAGALLMLPQSMISFLVAGSTTLLLGVALPYSSADRWWTLLLDLCPLLTTGVACVYTLPLRRELKSTF